MNNGEVKTSTTRSNFCGVRMHTREIRIIRFMQKNSKKVYENVKNRFKGFSFILYAVKVLNERRHFEFPFPY